MLGSCTLLGLAGWRLLPFASCRALSLALTSEVVKGLADRVCLHTPDPAFFCLDRILVCSSPRLSLAMWLSLGPCVYGPSVSGSLVPFCAFFVVVSISRFVLCVGWCPACLFLFLFMSPSVCIQRLALHSTHCAQWGILATIYCAGFLRLHR